MIEALKEIYTYHNLCEDYGARKENHETVKSLGKSILVDNEQCRRIRSVYKII